VLGIIEEGHFKTRRESLTIDSPLAIAELCSEMRFLDRESLRVVLLNAKQHLIKVATVSQGSVNETLAHPREIFKPGIVHSPYSFVGVDPFGHRSGGDGSRLVTRSISAGRICLWLYLALRCTMAFYRSSRQRSMAKTQKIIISCAITGAIHTPSMSPYLPVTPDQITEASIGAAKAGAAMVHLHARNPETGKPDHSPKAFTEFLPRIKQSTDAVIKPDQRWRALHAN
jgi:hypothetical protein